MITQWAARFAAIIALAVAGPAICAPVHIAILSSSPKMISGNDTLAEIALGSAKPSDLRVRLNGRDVTAAFRFDPKTHALVGLVSGLTPGRNVLEAVAKGEKPTRLWLHDYPITGPILSGPQVQPFICQTDAFVLPGRIESSDRRATPPARPRQKSPTST